MNKRQRVKLEHKMSPEMKERIREEKRIEREKWMELERKMELIDDSNEEGVDENGNRAIRIDLGDGKFAWVHEKEWRKWQERKS